MAFMGAAEKAGASGRHVSPDDAGRSGSRRRTAVREPGEHPSTDHREPPDSALSLGLTLEFVSAGSLDSQVTAGVVEERQLFAGCGSGIHSRDVEVVVACRMNVHDGAFE